MAGSVGKAKWLKYFQEQTIDTFMKEESLLYSTDAKPLGKKIPKLSEIKFHNEGAYNPKALITWNKESYRVSFDSIGKPNRKSSFTLKPQDDLNVKGLFTLNALIKYTQDKLYRDDKFSDNVINYIFGLLLYAEKPRDSRVLAELTKMYSMWKTELPLNTINNDFGELIGAIYLIKHDPKFKGATKIEFPTIGNEPLMDYKFVGTNVDYTISAKSSASTASNVVKPKGVLELLHKNKKEKKWVNTVPYKIVKTLNENSIQSGPILVVSEFAKTIPEFKKADKSSRYSCEKAIEAYSKRDVGFKNMFLDAIGANVYYAYFKINNNGVPEIKCDPDNMKTKTIFLRSKNSINSASDKMGFQP